ncbi:MAG: adenylate kinase family protein [Candidatus Methanoplasma sp.]|jgi:adenylate kinase|nr:adenylate kinase family protein [Candidatus Methanoplasma sp.]
MALAAVTGTPGTGKTALASELSARGRSVIDLNRHIRERGLLGEKDEERDTYSVDIDGLNLSLEEYRRSDRMTIMDGHLSHCVDCDLAIVLRCAPGVLARRLEARGYGRSKVIENVQAEVIDVILCEAVESRMPVYEIDCTTMSVREAADAAEEILSGNTDKYLPGNVSWLGDLEEWF